jgi:regulator of sigma E protease
MIKFGQLFLSLTILITLHEFGHFFFAKRFKCRVEKFYLFFDFLFPFAGLLNFSLFKKKIGDTVYGLGWFPFGGYVQIAGMVDEQMDKATLEKEPEPWEFRAKPAWQRMLIMVGGILVNLLLGIFIYWMVFFYWGKSIIPPGKLVNGIACDSTALKMGLRDGDIPLSVDGVPVTNLKRVPVEIVMNKAASMEVLRGTEKVTIPISEDDVATILRNLKKSDFVSVRMPTEVAEVVKASYAESAGLKKGDLVVAVNDIPTPYFHEFQAQLARNKDKEAKFTVLRGLDTVVLKSKVSLEGKLGFLPLAEKYYPIQEFKYGFFESLGEGVKFGMENLVMQAKQLVVIFTVKGAHEQVGGFYSMYQNMNAEWDWHDFWAFTGFLSLVLAFMNFLPIPMLDGGYILFLIIEMVSRRKVPEKVLFYANYVGLVIILGLMIYANTDWIRHR